jgi:PmbA protein
MSIKNILNKAIADAESAEVYSVRKKSMQVSFENNEIKDSSSSDLGGASIRLIKNGKLGFSSSSEPDDESIAKFALELAEHGKEVKFDFASPSNVNPFKCDTSDLESLTEDSIISSCEETVNELKKIHFDALAQCSFASSVSNSQIMNSKGVDFGQTTKKISWGCGLAYNTEGNFLTVDEYRIEREFTGFEPLVKQVKENFELSQKTVDITPGKYRVLFSPRGFMFINSVFTSCLNGFALIKGISPWKNKMGEKIFDEKISIYSNLIDDDSPRKVAMDDEGVATGITPLIEKGVLKSFYHSLDTAAQTGQKPTGHGFKNSYASVPSPSPAGFMFSAGDSNLSDMVKDAELWIDELIGAMMSNPYSGVISGNAALVFKMEKGRKIGKIKDVMISVNVFDLFKSAVIASSIETEKRGYEPFFPVFRSPYYLIDGVSIAAK